MQVSLHPKRTDVSVEETGHAEPVGRTSRVESGSDPRPTREPSRKGSKVPGLDAAIFDLDGVVLATERIHAKAWTNTFDDFLQKLEKDWDSLVAAGKVKSTEKFDRATAFRSFTHADYLNYVDGKDRYVGTESFLRSRGIDLPWGDQKKDVLKEGGEGFTVSGLSNAKNVLVNRMIDAPRGEDETLVVFHSTLDRIRELKALGVKIAAASSSQNAPKVLKLAGAFDLFDEIVCGLDITDSKAQSKPSPYLFVEAARRLGVDPSRAVVFEDAQSGVQAGRAGGFGLVVGLARKPENAVKLAQYADVVFSDLRELSVTEMKELIATKGALEVSRLSFTGYDAKEQRLQETLCTVGNGYFATRGILWPGTDANLGSFDQSYPGTYLAGVYDKASTEISGRAVENDDMVNCPNWLTLKLRIGDDRQWLDPHDRDHFRILDAKQDLDMESGVLKTTLRLKDKRGRETLVEAERFAHMGDPHRAHLKVSVTPLDYSAPIHVRSGLDGNVQNKGVERYGDLASAHLDPTGERGFGEAKDGVSLSVTTKQSKIQISEAERLRVFSGEAELAPKRTVTTEGAAIYQDFSIDAKKGQRYDFEKSVAIFTSRDADVKDPAASAEEHAESAMRFEDAKALHSRVWSNRWQAHRIELQGKETGFAQQVLDLHAYHLMTTASPHNAKVDAGMPARGLSGESYRGHIFWDTALIMSFFDRHEPTISRALLEYRVQRLPGALENAKIDGGYQGAMYPWQSGFDGSETTQTVSLNPVSGTWGPDDSRRQRHISFDIFYDAFNYWQRTGDTDFLAKGGAEMMLQIARFGADLAKKEADGRYHIQGVMGPDEFHEHHEKSPGGGLRDNAYTNLMVTWTLMKTKEILGALPADTKAELMKKLGLSDEELRRWDDVSRKMSLSINEDGIVAQFDGYFDLKELDWDRYREKYGNVRRMDRLLKAEGDSPDHYQVAKQADALMIFYMLPPEEVQGLFERLGYQLDASMLQKNFDYYLPRTSHGSTLSKVVHAHLASLLGRNKEAMELYDEVLRSDIQDVQGGTTAEGIHSGVMAGSIAFVERALLGIDIDAKGTLKIAPKLPEGWDQVTLPPIMHRGVSIQISATNDEVKVRAEGLEPKQHQTVEVFGKKKKISGGRDYTFSRLGRAELRPHDPAIRSQERRAPV